MTWPDESPASPRAAAAPSAQVSRALDAPPPLPGESANGWAGLEATPPNASGHEHAGQAVVTYTCPMHSDVVSERPGQCPRCGMALVQRDAAK